jgi:restriction system protein
VGYMEKLQLEDLVPVVSLDKNYWLVRTQGGRYYDEFVAGGFIAIGWDKISLQDIKKLKHQELIKKVKNEYPKRARPGRLANQLSDFYNEIKAGDTVIIPSSGSNKITIGQVEESAPYSETINEKNKGPGGRKPCPFQKRRKVKWLKTVSKWNLDMNFFKLFKSQHTISSANEYESYIDRLLYTFFIRGDEAHLILDVKAEGKIPFQTLFPMGTEIIKLAEDFNSKTGVELDLSDVEVKINVQSPGRIHLTGQVKTMLGIGFLLILLVGGEVSFDVPMVEGNVSLKMGSLITTVSDYLDAHQDREHNDLLLKTYMKELKVETPEELKTLIEINNSSTVGTVPPAKE